MSEFVPVFPDSWWVTCGFCGKPTPLCYLLEHESFHPRGRLCFECVLKKEGAHQGMVAQAKKGVHNLRAARTVRDKSQLQLKDVVG